MRSTFDYILLLVLFMGYTSCSDNDNSKSENGKPSFIETNQNVKSRIKFYYQDNHISKIVEKEGSTIYFEYNNNELISLSLCPTNQEIMDGNIFIKFSKVENKIIINKSGDCETSTAEIELNENDIPIKMTYKGLDFPELENSFNPNISYYSQFTFAPQTSKLLKEEIFYQNYSDIIYSYTYEYEESPGIFNEINLPLWFHAYCCHYARNATTGFELLFANYTNNVLEKNIDLFVDDMILNTRINYVYSYDKCGFPGIITTHNRDKKSDNQIINIKY